MPFIEEANGRICMQTEDEYTLKREFTGVGIAQHLALSQLYNDEGIALREPYVVGSTLKVKQIETSRINPTDSKVIVTYSNKLKNPGGGIEDPDDPTEQEGFPIWSGSADVVEVTAHFDLDGEGVHNQGQGVSVPEPHETAQCSIRWANPSFAVYNALRGKANNAAFYRWATGTVLYLGYEWRQNETLLYEIVHHFEIKLPDQQFHYYLWTKTTASLPLSTPPGGTATQTVWERAYTISGGTKYYLPEQTARIIELGDFDGLGIPGA